MASSPLIETNRLRIQPFCEQFLTERYVGWLNDRELTRYSNQRFRTHTITSCRDYMKSFDETANYFWAITSRDKNLGHIGNINAYIDAEHNTADIGILVGERLSLIHI